MVSFVDRVTLFVRAGLQGEQRVVATAADVGAGVEVRAAQTDDDLAGEDLLAAEALHAEALRVGVTTVLGARSTLLVSHCSVLLKRLGRPRASAQREMSVTLTWVYFWR